MNFPFYEENSFKQKIIGIFFFFYTLINVEKRLPQTKTKQNELDKNLKC